MTDKRTNKIIKIHTEDFSIKLLYDLFIDYLQQGDDGWELMRKRDWPYGAILRVPNWKDGEYGYAGIMFNSIIGNGQTHAYSINNNCSYGKWATQASTIKKYIAKPIMEIDASKNTYFITDNSVQAYQIVDNSTEQNRYSFDFGDAAIALLNTAGKDSTEILVGTEDNISGTVNKGTYITVDGINYIVTENSNVKNVDGKYALSLKLNKPLNQEIKEGSIVQVPSNKYKKQIIRNQHTNPVGKACRLREAEIFYKNADVIWFNMFKQYEEAFDWNELMENTRNNPSPARLGYAYDSQPYPSFDENPPVYPGEGCPAIGSSPNYFNEKTETFTTPKFPDEYVYVYMSKTKHNASLAINHRDWWDFASVGFFKPFASKYEYAFPALAMSSNSGVRPDVQLVQYVGSPYPYHKFYFDYTQDNRSFGHAMIGQAASWWNGDVSFLDEHACSQVQAMLPNGKWKSFFNYGIRCEWYYMYRQVYLWDKGFKDPELLPADVNKYFITTTMHQDKKGIFTPLPYESELSIIDWNLDNFDKKVAVYNTEKYPLMPFYIGERTADNINQNMLGALPAVYMVPRPVTRYGLYRNPDNDKDLYLIMPNCFEGRRWNHIHNFTYLLGRKWTEEELQSEYDRLDELSRSMNMALYLGENTNFEVYKPTEGE